MAERDNVYNLTEGTFLLAFSDIWWGKQLVQTQL